jgi:hypothetical protein
MKKSKPTPAPVASFDAATLATLSRDTLSGIVATLLAQSQKGDDTATLAKTAKQWENEGRTLLTPAFFDACAHVVNSGIIAPEVMIRAIGRWEDDDGLRAPVYGVAKIVANIRTLATGEPSRVMSDLHRALLLSLSFDFQSNDALHKGIAAIAHCSATGTAPTQRSSSAYSLRALALLEEKREGRTGSMRYRECEGSRTLARIVAGSQSQRDIMRG